MSASFLTAVINEEECIGCNRCVPACPVDAIIGTRNYLHTVLLDECIGCKLCLPPCPVDCIEIVPLAAQLPEDTVINKQSRAIKAKKRHSARLERLKKQSQKTLPIYQSREQRSKTIKAEIAAAVLRVKKKQKFSIDIK